MRKKYVNTTNPGSQITRMNTSVVSSTFSSSGGVVQIPKERVDLNIRA